MGQSGTDNTEITKRNGDSYTSCKTVKTSGLLNKYTFRPFWVSWANNIISVGQGSSVGDHRFIWCNADPGFAVSAVSVYSKKGPPGAEWDFSNQIGKFIHF